MNRKQECELPPLVWPSIRRKTLSGKIVVRGFTVMLRSMTPYERDCMAKVNYSQADREPVDPCAKRVFEAAVERFDAAWMVEMRQRWRETPTVADIVESCNREPMKWPNVRWG